MNNGTYLMYIVAMLVVGGIAVWAGLPPSLLILLLAYPLMMFFMMRGMDGGMRTGHGHGDSDDSIDGTRDSNSTRPADLDGSHERAAKLSAPGSGDRSHRTHL